MQDDAPHPRLGGYRLQLPAKVPEVERWPANEALPKGSSRWRQLSRRRLDEESDPFRGAAKPAPESPDQPEQPPYGIGDPAQSLQPSDRDRLRLLGSRSCWGPLWMLNSANGSVPDAVPQLFKAAFEAHQRPDNRSTALPAS
jgi:hypothetical protein